VTNPEDHPMDIKPIKSEASCLTSAPLGHIEVFS
jgi:hypothetical protein